MPYKVNQLPAGLFAAMVSLAAERRHSCKAHSILDHPENLAVREVLRFRLAEIRRSRVKTASDHRVAAAVVPMADRAVIREVQPRVSHILR